jgi:hypothetical protein
MGIFLYIDKSIVCRLLEENKTKLIQLCLYQNNKPLCLDHKVSMFNWEEHNYYIQVMNTILINFNLQNSNFINIYASKIEIASELIVYKLTTILFRHDDEVINSE